VLRWIFLGRLSLATGIFVAAVFAWENAVARDTLIATLALFAAIAFTVGSAWLGMIRRGPVGRSFYYSQALFDVVLVTAIVHITGGAVSQFAALYILVTAAASLTLPVGAGLLVAAFGNVLYFCDVFWGHGTPIELGVVLQLVVFAMVALGTAYLSARLREVGADKEELEAQLAFARLQAEDILRNIRSGILTMDAHGRLLYANPAAGKLLGFDADGMLGKPIRSLLDQNAPDLAHALDRGVRRRERITRGEATITVDGRSFPLGLTTTTIDADQEGAIASATAIFQDISDNKRLEELRLRAERLEAVAELSASLAHEIKNPLASIRSAVEQLACAPKSTDDERTLGSLIVRESDRLARLLSEFLDFARTRVARKERVDVGDVAEAAARLAKTHPDCANGVKVGCVAPKLPLHVEGDEDLLHRAIFNVALNAIQATPAFGEVRIEVTSVPSEALPRGVTFGRDAVAIRIIDTGPGISPDIRDRVFDPFFTTKASGTGLGLPIVHRAIEAHRGIVLLDSSRHGTRFTILLPRWRDERENAA
jgi:two-component system sensor histidine kinase PilS (NtrC family)